jgi:N-acetylmuramoyl-L-alanine amidase
VTREGVRCIVRVPGARLAESVPSRAKGIGLVDSVQVSGDPAGAVFTFWLDPAAGPAELVARPSPPRLELVVSSPEAADALPGAEFQQRADLPASRPVRVIVLDPGHGGSDEGAKSEGGLAEKEVTLALAKRARDLLAADGFRVVLTRDRDVFVPPEARARLAHREEADAFLSFHANAWFDSDLEGFGLGVSSAPATPPGDPLTPSRWGSRDTTAVRGSDLLAELLSTHLAKGTGRPNRGVSAAAWAPLAGVSTAAVVVECGFLTNGGDAKRLGEAAYRDKVAAAVAGALRAYRDSVRAALAACERGDEP